MCYCHLESRTNATVLLKAITKYTRWGHDTGKYTVYKWIKTGYKFNTILELVATEMT